jgi:MFS family permease
MPHPLNPKMSEISLDDALDLNVIGFYQYRLLTLCGLAWMADALELNLLTYLSSCAGVEFGLSETEKASISSVAFLGVIIGSSVCGMISDQFGRRVGFLASTVLTSIGGFITAFAPSYSILLISRFIVGLGLGGANIPFDLLAEFLPAKQRGKFLISTEYFWTLGSSLVSLLAWLLLDQYGWRALVLVVMLPVLITSIFAMFYIPESPRWLLVKQRRADAEVLLKESMKVNGITNIPPFQLKTNDHDHSSSTPWSTVLMKIIRDKVTFPQWIVWACMGFSYYGFVLFISRIYSMNDSHSSSASSTTTEGCSFDYSNILYNSLSEIIGVTCCMYMLERVGRVNMQLSFYALSAIAVFLMGFELNKNYVFMIIGMIGRMSIMTASVRSILVFVYIYMIVYLLFLSLRM